MTFLHEPQPQTLNFFYSNSTEAILLPFRILNVTGCPAVMRSEKYFFYGISLLSLLIIFE